MSLMINDARPLLFAIRLMNIIEFVQTGISAIRFADPENLILEPNTA